MGWRTGRVEKSKKKIFSTSMAYASESACVRVSREDVVANDDEKTTMSERVSERVCFDDARWGPCAKMTVVFAANPENLETIIKRFAYVVYPPEGPKPPTAEEMRKIVEANKKRR